MTRPFALALAALLLAGAGCGKYGPPVRAADTPAPKATASGKTPAVAATPAAADTEECADPNAPAAASGATP